MQLVGDSARGPEFAFVRLRLDGDRIVDADAAGLERSLVGLTLLEAAAVGGETLAVDALANALGPVFRAPRSPGRVAVAMSGGVDSAVALLRSLPNAIGVTLRLWLDPDGPDAERACCSPEAVIAARETCHALGVPHVTLDLREDFRRAVVGPFVRGYARGETPNPCMRCNGAFRFGRLLAVARRSESQEACFLAGDDYRSFLERQGLDARTGSLVDEDGRELGRHGGHWRFTPGQRKGLGVSAPEPLYALRSEARTNTVVVGPRTSLARTSVAVAGRLYLPVARADVKLRYRSEPLPARVETTARGFRLELDEQAHGVAPGQAAVLYDEDIVVGAGLIRTSA